MTGLNLQALQQQLPGKRLPELAPTEAAMTMSQCRERKRKAQHRLEKCRSRQHAHAKVAAKEIKNTCSAEDRITRRSVPRTPKARQP